MIRSRTASVALLAAAFLALAGCAAPVEPPVATPTASAPAPEPSENSPAPAPSPTMPAVDELVLTAGGLGPIRIGQTLTGIAAEMAPATSEGCSRTYWQTAPEYTVPDGGYTQSGGQAFVVGGGDDGAMVRIDAMTSSIETDRGIHVGSTLDEVLAAYPEAVELTGPITNLWVVAGTGGDMAGQLIMEVAIDDGSGYWGDKTDTVVHLRAQAAQFEPYPIAASGNVVGTCLDDM